MISISAKDLHQLVRESFEEGLLEGVQKGRGFKHVEWEASQAKTRLEAVLNDGTASASPAKRRFVDPGK